MTEPRFDEVIHAPQRLRIMAALTAVNGEIEFATLRALIDSADSVLSKHLKTLADAGYLTLSKPTGRGRVRTWVRATKSGRAAYDAHVAALREILARHEPLHDTGTAATRP